MTSTGRRDLPSDERALLMAATQSRDVARAAWEQWKGISRLETVGPRSQAIFGQVYANVVGDLEGPETMLLRGVYKRTWYANQVLLGRVQPLVGRLTREGASPILLNDAALALAYYTDLGHRTIDCLDVLVPAASWRGSLAAATDEGWRFDENLSFGCPGSLSIATFAGRQEGTLRIWADLFAARPQHDTEARLWRAARSLEVNGQTFHVLGAEEQLLSTSADAFRKREVPLSRYADAALVAHAITSEHDWARVVWKAQRYEHILPLRSMLRFLERNVSIALPAWLLPELRRLPISHGELLQYRPACDTVGLKVKAVLLRVLRTPRAGSLRG